MKRILFLSSIGAAPGGKMFAFDTAVISEYWYNLREAFSIIVKPFTNNKRTKACTSPSCGLRTDWVLVFD